MALVRKILETTIASGGTTATFTDADIPNSLIRIYSTDSNKYPQNISLTGNVLTVTYETVSSALGVALEIVKQGLTVTDSLLSTAADEALSANQGYVLSGMIGTVSGNLDILTETVNNLNIPDEITDLNDIDISSIQDGQILAWDANSSKFVNITPEISSEIHYTSEEVKIGSFLNVDLYRKTFDLGSDVSVSYNGWTTLSAVISDIYLIINCWGTNVGGTFTPLQGTYNASKQIQVQTPRNGYNQNVRFLTIEYTKSGIT